MAKKASNAWQRELARVKKNLAADRANLKRDLQDVELAEAEIAELATVIRKVKSLDLKASLNWQLKELREELASLRDDVKFSRQDVKDGEDDLANLMEERSGAFKK